GGLKDRRRSLDVERVVGAFCPFEHLGHIGSGAAWRGEQAADGGYEFWKALWGAFGYSTQHPAGLPRVDKVDHAGPSRAHGGGRVLVKQFGDRGRAQLMQASPGSPIRDDDVFVAEHAQSV